MKLCPLRKTEFNEPDFYCCYEENCQWWITINGKDGDCAITHIGLNSIILMLGGLQKAKEKINGKT